MGCSVCGLNGHNATTCPRNGTVQCKELYLSHVVQYEFADHNTV
ncbi:hypothetical protein PPL_09980 [Heterostelium album PN500]|uniref:CCHC-type domain-containing protein n=1 Tax=Heterostelium pallidum (strain ATCC 26659 / Pp 5 / PN500) TaxID=670386 RepID=D3BPT6_HETP5|nr:hypothetical protein PPL_09980 [Heterostelium album PN500]EFA76219.1 hypothetical protein PPL_09980 [Heterostelium album PN500]|eukprot:XP_020428352.1 hypothetical protein PPL_09980 [Heterostelium album PN500]